jgi:outer membrane receptor protein involved in Fe transport
MMPQQSLSTWSAAFLLTFVSSTAFAQDGNAIAPLTVETGPESASPPAPEPAPAPAPSAPDPSAPEAAPVGATASDSSDESQAATQVASFAVTQLKDSPAVVTVISGEDIRAVGARDLIDILNLVPGFFLGVDIEGVVGPGFRGMWGHEGKILLIIDGKEMNELLFSNMQLGNEFPVELIDRVEVVRGPGSVIYGGNAELAVINVVTRGLQGSTDVMATATYGQITGANQFGNGYGRRKITASGRLVVDSVPGLSSFGSVSIGQGQRSVRTYFDNAGGSATLEGQSALDPTVVQAGVGYRDVQATFLYQHLATTNIDGFGAVLAPALRVSFDALHGELVGTFHPNNRLEIVPRFNVSYQTPWRAQEDANDLFYDKSVRRLRGRLLGRWAALDQLQITAGGDAIFDHGSLNAPAGTGQQSQFNGADTVDYQTFGGYLELFSENPVVNVAAGARYDHLSTIGGKLVPRLVLLRSFGHLSLKGLSSLSFRTPSLENISSSVGTSKIRPESTRIFEFEAAWDLTPEQRFSANIYDVLIEAPIAYTHDPVTNTDGYLNLGRQGTRGLELSYRLRSRLVRLEANYSFYSPSVSDNVPPYTVPGHSEQFLAAPAHRASARATFRPWEWLGISPSVVFLGERFTRGNPGTTGAETAVALPAQLLANLFVYSDNVGVRGLTIGLGLYNIFGADYHFGHPYAGTPADNSPMAVAEAFAADHAPLPSLDREIMLRVSYLVEP